MMALSSGIKSLLFRALIPIALGAGEEHLGLSITQPSPRPGRQLQGRC